MKLHGNAKTCPHSRLLICERVLGREWSLARAAAAAGVSERTAAKWLVRYRAEGEEGLSDRSSAPARVPSRTSAERVAVIAALRRLRMTAAEIADLLSMPLSTVSLILLRIGLGKRSRLEPLEPPNRYEKARPGELLHIDVKKLARIARPGHRIHGDRSTRVQGVGGSTCMSASMTRRGSPTRNCFPTSVPPQRSLSCTARSLTSPPSASALSASSPTDESQVPRSGDHSTLLCGCAIVVVGAGDPRAEEQGEEM